MVGWQLPEPSSAKSDEQLRRERDDKCAELVRLGMLRSERLRRAMLTVRREDFVPVSYRDHSYQEVPLRLPGRHATISCPHSYPLFYEALGLEEGQRLLEVGLGSGYGAALAREVVGPRGLVVSMEIDPDTFAYAAGRLDHAGYTDVVRVLADGGAGWPAQAPYDRICVTAACRRVPPPLLEQLKADGKLIVPLVRDSRQVLTLFEKTPDGLHRTEICDVLYVRLQGAHSRRCRAGEGPQPSLVACGGLAGGRRRRPARARRACDGGAVWDALVGRDGTAPRVDLPRPDVLVNAEVLGPMTLVGIVRRAWRDNQIHGRNAADVSPDGSEGA